MGSSWARQQSPRSLVATGTSMFSERAQKQLLLLGGIASGAAGIATAFATIIGAAADFFKKIGGATADAEKWPPWTYWLVAAAFFSLGLWLLIKWRTRHSRLLKPDALRLDRDNPEHLVGRADDI